MKEFFSKYVTLRKHNAQVAWKKAKKSKMCYAFLAPYAILFTLFYVVPVVISIFTALPTTTFWRSRDLSDWRIISV